MYRLGYTGQTRFSNFLFYKFPLQATFWVVCFFTFSAFKPYFLVFNKIMGSPQNCSFVGRGGAREKSQFSPYGGNGDLRTLRRREGCTSCSSVLQEIITYLTEQTKTPKPSRFSGFYFCLDFRFGANLVQVILVIIYVCSPNDFPLNYKVYLPTILLWV